MNILDRAIAWVNPERGMRRAAMRKALAQYDGAEINRRTGHWRRNRGDANAALQGNLANLQAVARDLIRNNPRAARAAECVVNNTVGTGIVPKIKAKPGEKSVKETDLARLNELLKRISESRDLDADGTHNLAGLERLILRAVFESGECLVRRRLRRPSDGYAVPFQIQVMEPDYLDTSKDGALNGGGAIIQGIEFDAIGRRVAYHLFTSHPGAVVGTNWRTTSSRVPASEIAHIRRVDRPGQVRGVPWLAPVMVKLKELGDYDDAQLMRQKIAACFAAFVHGSEETDPLSAVDPVSEDRLETLAPGIIEHLPLGKDVTFANPPTVEGYADVMKISDRTIAAGIGITYEALTGDYGNVNFSSGRMGWIEMFRNIEAWRWNMLIPQGLDVIASWFLEAAEFAFDANVVRRVFIEWTAPRREMINPTEEIKTAISAIRAGLLTWQEWLRQSGYDPLEVAREMAEDQTLWEQYGFVLDIDPSKVSAAGLAQPDNQQAPAAPNN